MSPDFNGERSFWSFATLWRCFAAGIVATVALLTVTGAIFGEQDQQRALASNATAVAQSEASAEAEANAAASGSEREQEADSPRGAEDAAAGEAIDADDEVSAATPNPQEPAPVLADNDETEIDLEEIPSEDQTQSLTALRDAGATTPWYLRLLSLLGMFVYVGIAVALSRARKAINWRLVAVGLGLQFAFALFILKTGVGKAVFATAGAAFSKLLSFTQEGNRLLFGSFVEGGDVMPSFMNFAFDVLPTIIFFSSLMSVLYHVGIMQRVVGAVAAAMRKTMQTSGAETLSAAANIFVGQTEAPLMVKPYVNKMTMSELMAVMTGGFATVAGGVMASYIGFLQSAIPDIAEHLLAASVMSAPAALVMAKIMQPEVDTPETADGVDIDTSSPHANVVDAAANGAAEGLQLALNVAAMLLAFVALVAMFNYLFALPSYIQHASALRSTIDAAISSGWTFSEQLATTCDFRSVDVAPEARLDCIEAIRSSAGLSASSSAWPVVTLERLVGWLFYPLAAVSGAPLSDAVHLGELYGQKTILNEFYAYVQLATKLNDPSVGLDPRTVIIASYGLCGFANLSSIAIQIGGISGIAPDRRSDLARIGIRAMIAGTLAAWMTGNIVGLLI